MMSNTCTMKPFAWLLGEDGIWTETKTGASIACEVYPPFHYEYILSVPVLDMVYVGENSMRYLKVVQVSGGGYLTVNAAKVAAENHWRTAITRLCSLEVF